MYSEEEILSVSEHIEKYFGKYGNVFHEIVSPDIHVDIAIIEPSDERKHYTLVTMGMGAHGMNVPKKLKRHKLDRAELMISLPADWNIRSDDERWYWPIRWLKIIARIPIENDTWIGWGHTIPSGEPVAGTRFTCMMIVSPAAEDERAHTCAMPDGSEVNFYQVVPLYEEEMNFKLEHGAEPLLDRMDDETLEAVDINRKNACS